MQGLECFQKALEIDPDYSLAQTGVADAHSMIAFYGFNSTAESVPKAKAAAIRALELDPNLAESHTALAIASLQDWDFETARREFERAIELNPRYAPARYWYGLHYLGMTQGRLEDGLEQCRLAVEIDPLSSFPAALLGMTLTISGRPEEGLEVLEPAARRDPQNGVLQRGLGLAHRQAGDLDAGLAHFRRALEITNRHPWAMMEVGTILVMMGRANEAEAYQDELEERAQSQYVSPYAMSEIPSWLGQTDKALDLLEQALEVRDATLYVVRGWLGLHPDVRRHERFRELLARIGLSDLPAAD